MHVRVEGFWTLATLARFSVSALATFSRTRLTAGHFTTLVDCRAFPIQSGDIATGLERVAQQSARITTGPVATVVAANLDRLQANRIMPSAQFRTFVDWNEASA